MALQTRNLNVLAYANGFTLWHYSTMDFASEIHRAGYFDKADQLLRSGDLIVATAGDGGAAILSVSERSENAVATQVLAGRPQAVTAPSSA
jgi:hypothetical protein